MQHQHKEHELEKPNEQYLERTGTETGSTRSPADDGNGSADYPGKGSDMEKRLLRRIDLRLVPALGFMYACSLMDRTNLPNARVSGMDRELGTGIGTRYTIIVMLFFIPYILTEIPANMALKAGVHPRLWLPTATLLFGVAMIGHGFAKNWQTLAGLRVPLGAFEGFLFPGSIFLISSWYPRYETQKRISAFYLSGASFSGFSNIIAYGFSEMGGLGTYNGRPMLGYRWIFIMMGLLTVVSAFIGYAVVPNFPAKATFLSAEERQLVQDRINVDRRDFENEHLTVAGVIDSLKNWKIWAFGLLFLCSTLPAYAFSYFLVIILNGFGYSARDSQLLSAPPYITAVVVGMISAWVSDKTRMRGPYILLGAITSATGTIILGYTSGTGPRYFGSFLAIIGCQSNIPAVMAWSQNNIRGYTARAVASAVTVGGGGIGGIIASVAFRSQDRASGYRPGLWTAVAAQMVILVVASFLMLHFRSENRKVRTEGKVLLNSVGFQYTL